MRLFWTTALVLATVSCASRLDGPTPAITGVAPDIICTAQADQTVVITGSGFSPAVIDGLTDPTVMMPQVFLDDIEIPAANVKLPAGDTSGTMLELLIPMGLLAPNSAGDAEVVYDIRVVNPNGHEGSLADALTVVPPPQLVAVDPSSGAQETIVPVTLTGTGFRAGMTVTLDANPPVSGANVSVVSSTEATADFDLTGVAAGTYDVTVTNADGCSSTLTGAFTVFVPSVFELTGIDPPFGCNCEDTTVTINSAGGFVSTPRVEMRPNGQSTPVIRFERVAFLDANTLTAVMPAGTQAVGNYDVTVINPPSDGGIATLANGFRVVSLPVPTIEAIVPARGSATSDTLVAIFGEHFRDPVTVELIDGLGNVEASVTPVTPTSATRLDLTLPTAAMIEDIYLVRVTNLDQNTYSTFSAFLVAETGPSGNLQTATLDAPLTTGRRMLAGATARDDLGNRYLYAIGGDTGAGGTVLDSVEVSQLSKFGALGGWADSRNTLAVPRVGPAAVAVPTFDPNGSPFIPVKTYLYVLGGTSDTGAVLDTVERAMVLQQNDAPRVTSIARSSQSGSLVAGTWYYKVSAVLTAADPDNPGGETLASDEAILTIGGTDGAIDLAWDAVNVNGMAAAEYRIYRTDGADGASQTEHLIATVSGTSYTDAGDAAGIESPLPPGSTGVWVAQTGTLAAARWGHQAALVSDADGDQYIHVIGGKSDATTGFLASVEIASVDAADGSLGTFATAGANALPTARAFFSLTVATPENVSGLTGGDRLFALGGVAANGGVGNNHASNLFQMSDVELGGGNAAWANYSGASSIGTRAGPMALITSDKLFVLGGGMSATTTAVSGILTTGSDVGFNSNGTIGSPIQSAAGTLLGARALGVVITGSGFIYFVGGTSDGTNALATTERSF